MCLIFLPQTSKVTPRDTKSVPSSRNVRKTVRNVIRKTPHFIALSMVKIKVTPLGSVTSSRKGLKIKTILNMEKRNTRRSSKNLISWRQNLPNKSPSMKNINKYFAKKKTFKEETVILYDTSDRNSSSISEADNSPDEYEKTSIAYDSESSDKDKSSSSFIISEENNWPNGCRDSFIIDKLKPNSKSNIKYHRLSFNHLDKALVYSHLLNTLQSPTNKIYKQI